MSRRSLLVASFTSCLSLALVACTISSGGVAEDDSAGTRATTDGTRPDETDGASESERDSIDRSASFVGVWKVTRGTSTVDCPGTPVGLHYDNDDSGGTIRIEQGASPDMLVAVQEGTGCKTTLAVSGNVAKAIGNEVCTPETPHVDCSRTESSFDGGVEGGHRLDDGGVPPITYVSRIDEFTLSDDGQTLREKFVQDLVNYVELCDDGVTVAFDCNVTGQDELQKQP